MYLFVLRLDQILQPSDIPIPLVDAFLAYLSLFQHLQRHNIVPTEHSFSVFLGFQLLHLDSQLQVSILMANLGYLNLVVLTHLSLLLQLFVKLLPRLLVLTL